jgi:hypothetical protein
MMKKRLFLFLVLCLFLCLLPGTALAEDGPVTWLRVNDVDVLRCEHPEDVLGDGSVSFDRETGILTLNNAVLTQGVSDPAEEWMEYPAIGFSGSLTLHLKGSNTIVSDTHTVMGKSLRDNAICGDELTVTGEPGATLSANGMINVRSYTQRSGSVAVILSNDHGKITKWGMYVNGALCMKGGSLVLASVGKTKGGALMLEDRDALEIAPGAALYEGSSTPGTKVEKLTLTGSLTWNTRDYIRIELPDAMALAFGSIPVKGTAYAADQAVELDGRQITLPAYALKDEKGDPTNYVRLRDLAWLLDGTLGQFDVTWSAETGIGLIARHPYESPNGTEGNVPFTGDQPYTAYTGTTTVNGQPRSLDAFQITWEGGGHTYYKLRDLGKALGFNVGWTAARGLFIETDNPYTDTN